MIGLKLDTKALENLLKEDDGTIKLELQQAVIEEFCKRHIKLGSLGSDAIFKNMIKTIKDETLNEIESLFGEWVKITYSTQKFELNDQIKNMIKLQAKTAVTHELDKVEDNVIDLYIETAAKISNEYNSKLQELQNNFSTYLVELENEIEKMKKTLITNEIDGIMRKHLKSILKESFSLND